jgi:hypothetical protein
LFRERRKAANVSLAKAAVLANVSIPTARVYEIDPESVFDPRKRAALQRVYDGFVPVDEPADASRPV